MIPITAAARLLAAALAAGPLGLAGELAEVGSGLLAGEPPSSPPGARFGSAAAADSPAASPLLVGVTGSDYRWLVRYPGPDRRLGTGDDVLVQRNVHLPEKTSVTIRLESEDFIYTFSVPDWDLVDVAVPDLPFDLEVETGLAGKHQLKGSQMCGFAHSDLLGEIVVHTRAGFEQWIAEAGAP